MVNPAFQVSKKVSDTLMPFVAMKVGAVQAIAELAKCFTNHSALNNFIQSLLAMDFLGNVDEWKKTTLRIMTTCTTEPGAFLLHPTTIASLAACTTVAAAIALLRKLMKEHARSASASTPAAIEDLGCAAPDAAENPALAVAPEADSSSGEGPAQDTTCDGADEAEADSTLDPGTAAPESLEDKAPENVAAESASPADEATADETAITETTTAPQVTEAAKTAVAALVSTTMDESEDNADEAPVTKIAAPNAAEPTKAAAAAPASMTMDESEDNADEAPVTEIAAPNAAEPTKSAAALPSTTKDESEEVANMSDDEFMSDTENTGGAAKTWQHLAENRAKLPHVDTDVAHGRARLSKRDRKPSARPSAPRKADPGKLPRTAIKHDEDMDSESSDSESEDESKRSTPKPNPSSSRRPITKSQSPGEGSKKRPNPSNIEKARQSTAKGSKRKRVPRPEARVDCDLTGISSP